MESKEIFWEKIKNYYSLRNKEYYSEGRIDKLTDFLTEYFFYQYMNFRKEYPKSIKRYSTLKLEDLENPLIHDKIIFFIKENYKSDYIKFCALMLNLTEKDFIEYEKQRTKFNNMF